MFRNLFILLVALTAVLANAETRKQSKKSREAIIPNAGQELALAQTTTSSIEVTAPGKALVEIGFLAGTAMSTLTNSDKSASSLTNVKSQTEVVFSGGILANFNVNEMVSLESGIFYVPKDIGIAGNSGSANVDLVSSLRTLELPVMARVWFLKYFSIGAGGYYSMGVGNIDSVVRVDGKSRDLGKNASQTYKDAGVHAVDYGLLFGAQVKLPVSERFNFIVDSRYNLGLRDSRVNKSNNDAERFRTLRFFAGGSFSL